MKTVNGARTLLELMFLTMLTEALFYHNDSFQVYRVSNGQSGFELNAYRSVIEHVLVSPFLIYQGCWRSTISKSF